MSQEEEEEVRKIYRALTNDFNNPEVLAKAIDLSSYDSLSINEIDKIDELRHFFGLDEDGPYSEFLSKGLKSLRYGFYKICSQPFLNKGIDPHTFSASVYYFHPDFPDGELIKYEANVGPLINVYAGYSPLIGTLELEKISLWHTFITERSAIGTLEDHYLVPKNNFFNKVFNEGKIFFVLESIFHPSFPNANPKPKKVTWSFID